VRRDGLRMLSMCYCKTTSDDQTSGAHLVKLGLTKNLAGRTVNTGSQRLNDDVSM
jgi:hypothetical protein